MFKYMKFLMNKVKQYDRMATNPFLNKKPNESLYENLYKKRTCIWVEKPRNTE